MAQEINASASVSVSSGGQSVNGFGQFLADVTADGFIGDEQSIATSATALEVGDVAAPSVVFIKNLDDTNYVEVDSVNSFDNFPQKLMPGQAVLLLPQTATIYLKAHTAAVQVFAVVG